MRRGDKRGVGEAVDSAPFTRDLRAFDRLVEGGKGNSLVGFRTFFKSGVVAAQRETAIEKHGRLELRTRVKSDQMGVEAPGQPDGHPKRCATAWLASQCTSIVL